MNESQPKGLRPFDKETCAGIVLTSIQRARNGPSMAVDRKTEQLQIRVTPAEKAELRKAATAANMDVSAWMLARALGDRRSVFRGLLGGLPELGTSSSAYAALNDFLHEVPRDEFPFAVDVPPPASLSQKATNYVAAMVEHAAKKKNAPIPGWTRDVEPLKEPYFGTSLKRLRLLLMTTSPIAFRRRNIFVDSSVGDRV